MPTNPSQLAILALKVYKVFLRPDDMPPDSEVAKAIMEANERFEARRKQGDGSPASKKRSKGTFFLLPKNK